MKKVKTILISSLIVMAIVVVIVVDTQQQAKAELTFKNKLLMDNKVRMHQTNFSVCNNLISDPTFNVTASFGNGNKTLALSICDDSMMDAIRWCELTGETADRFKQSGLCESPLLTKYISQRLGWDKIR
jgi:hypothetical protein